MWVLNILNMLYTLRFFFSSKCSLFHNANLFGSCIIHFLCTGCAKIKKKFRRQRVNFFFFLHSPRIYLWFWYLSCLLRQSNILSVLLALCSSRHVFQLLLSKRMIITFRFPCYLNKTEGQQWPRGLRRGTGAACLLGLWVRIPSGAWMFVSCECCMLSSKGLCAGLITRPE